MLYINVPFSEKEEAKILGARWNSEKKMWYIRDRYDYPKFQKWILGDDDRCIILCDNYFIVEAPHTCFRCKNSTPVIGFGIESHCKFWAKGIFVGDPWPEYNCDEVGIASYINPIHENILGYLKEKYNYYYDYSKFAETHYYANHCNSCGVIQGRHFLFCEDESPFFIKNIEMARALKLYCVKMKEDKKVECNVSWGSLDHLINTYAQISDLHLTE